MPQEKQYLMLSNEIERAIALRSSGMRPGEAIRHTYDEFSESIHQKGCLPLIYFLANAFTIPLSDAKFFAAETLSTACREKFPDKDEYDSWVDVILDEDIQRELENLIALADEERALRRKS